MRCFIAAPLPHMVKEELIRLQKGLLDDSFTCTPVKPDAMHLTLAFLGPVKEEQVRAIQDALRAIRFEQIDTALCGIGVFPGKRHPRVIWAGLANEQRIAALARKVRAAMRPLGFGQDHAFAAHVTLCRVKQGRDAAALQQRITSMSVRKDPFTISSFALFSSKLTPDGPIHEILSTFDAAAPAGR